MKRCAQVDRSTAETRIRSCLNIDGKGRSRITSGVGFFDHMLKSLVFHGSFDLILRAKGDLEVDQHHLIEDSGLVLGTAFSRALGDRIGIQRAGFFVYPMDEALAVAAVDIGGRPFLQYDARFQRRFCGDMDTDLLPDFMHAFATGLMANLVVRMPYGRSDHHRMEAIFKALGKALQMACSKTAADSSTVPSTKGVI